MAGCHCEDPDGQALRWTPPPAGVPVTFVAGGDGRVFEAWQSVDAAATLEEAGYEIAVVVLPGGTHHSALLLRDSQDSWVPLPRSPLRPRQEAGGQRDPRRARGVARLSAPPITADPAGGAHAIISTMEHVPDLDRLISVVAESTISRTVLRAAGARVVLFGFDAGQELSEHTAAVPILLQVLDGRLRVGAAGEHVELLPGGLVHIDERVPHTVLALEPSRMVLVMLDPRATGRAVPSG
jgi:quercetin dioxygenase-like cupin family protein